MSEEENDYLKAIQSNDAEEALHALADEFEGRAENWYESLEEVDPEESPVTWTEYKAKFDGFLSAASTVRTVALSFEDDEELEEVK